MIFKLIDGERVAYLLGIPVGEFHKSLIKPKVKVGTEFVNKGQNVSQVLYTVCGLSKAIFERMFWWIVQRVNKALDTKERRSYFIGVLDIAGFEIFDVNIFFFHFDLIQVDFHYLVFFLAAKIKKNNLKKKFLSNLRKEKISNRT